MRWKGGYMMNGKSIFIAGHAKLPQGMAAKSVYDSLTVTLEIDKKYGVILEASCTLVTDHGKKFISSLLRGCSLKDGIDEAIELVQGNYKGKAQHALMAALRDVYTQYEIIH